jgi:hypothetical protein
METNRETFQDAIDELETLLSSVGQIEAVSEGSTDNRLPAIACKVLRCLGDRLSEIEDALNITG